MNKLFPLHTQSTGADHNRPYYTQTWEPIAIDRYNNNFIPFQYERVNTQYFYAGQVIKGVETDITSKFRSGTELITSWTPDTYAALTYTASDYTINSMTVLQAYAGQSIVSNYFTLVANNYLNFRIDTEYISVAGDVMQIIFRKGTTVLGTDAIHDGKNEIAYKVTASGSDYNIQIKATTIVGATLGILDGLYSCQKCVYEIHNDYLTYYNPGLYSSITAGVCTFKFQSTTKLYSENCIAVDSYTNASFFDDQIYIRIFSTYVDYANIYYKGGFIQTIYKFANVRRSPEPKITIIGDERNGVIVQEKVITSTRYQVKMKCSEEQLDAFTTAAGATILITDQTDRVFTVSNLEISKPDWYRTNGIVTLTFDDNINVYTQNQPDL